ncbi:hypothetical protein HY480_02530 [Candidatus Uhrbacteria bacterium]|nr:hypothetical protein [Candidatus Uhrbacteria bacterium]
MALDPEIKMVLEDIDKKFDILVEGRAADREKLDATFEAVGRVQEDVTELQLNMVEVKAQLDLIRNELKAKADRAELRLLEERVLRLERRALAT